MPRPAPAAIDRLTQAQAAEDAHRRLCRLWGMDSADLRAVLSGDPAKAAPWLESAARYGVVEAQLRLGQMQLDGTGLPRDEASALAWFMRAAGKGSPEAMNMVGRCHENGWGVVADPAAAARWYRRSAEAGHDWGQYNLAHLLFDGRGLAQDLAAAVGWYRRAADQGHSRAMNLLGRCLEEGWGVARNATEARTWYRRSAEAGYFRGQYNHATCLAVRGDLDEALTWFEAACRAASPESLGAMARELEHQADPRLSALGRRHRVRWETESKTTPPPSSRPSEARTGTAAHAGASALAGLTVPEKRGAFSGMTAKDLELPKRPDVPGRPVGSQRSPGLGADPSSPSRRSVAR
jgi:TPR repeat protein